MLTWTCSHAAWHAWLLRCPGLAGLSEPAAFEWNTDNCKPADDRPLTIFRLTRRARHDHCP